jgi:hypothetical protein
VGLSALLALVGLRLFDSRRWGVAPNLCIMILGMTVIGGSTWLRDGGTIGGFAWMVLTGVGAFLGYVACDTIFYERVIASTGWVGTAVFMAHVMDAGAYTGSVGLQLYYDLAAGGLTHLEFFRRFCYALSIGGTCVLVFSLAYFRWKARRVTGGGSGGRGPADPGKGARDRAPPG